MWYCVLIDGNTLEQTTPFTMEVTPLQVSHERQVLFPNRFQIKFQWLYTMFFHYEILTLLAPPSPQK